jgi:cyclopropane-fatty-acyl-phospholipid synthase
MPATVTLTAEGSARPIGLSVGPFSPGRRFLLHLARQVERGQLHIQMPSGEAIHCAGPLPGPNGRLVLHNWRAVRRMVFGGDIGFGESYMDGDWSTSDLTSLIALAACNHDTIVPTLNGSWLTRLLNRMIHLANGNTRRGSRRNIPAHYDLGNDFYAAWLDPGMTYSSGFYESETASLDDAQTAKQRLAIEALDLTGGERVLEIGCGWGGLAERLAREQGCHVTGLSLSPAQLDYARTRCPTGDAPGQVTLLHQDYRDCGGTFDRVVSIEMLEAVGQAYWPAYFSTIRDRLRPGGIAAVQVITMAEDRYDAYERGTDFIQKHIFPGGMLPTDAIMRDRTAAAGLVLEGVKTFGLSYARTLADWRDRFHRAWPDLRRLGFDERFRRKWDYYLSYCEAGFQTGALDVGLYRMRRPAGAC